MSFEPHQQGCSFMTSKPIILALETSSRIGSVAIAAGPELLAYKPFSGPMMHSAEIFPVIRELLRRVAARPQDIHHIYISIGPGSFTGLRIATAVAKTMHLANAVKIVAVDSLDVIAANVLNPAPDNSIQPSNQQSPTLYPRRIAPILDAKRGQFYIAIYQCCRIDNFDKTTEEPERPQIEYKKVQTDSLMTTDQIRELFTDSDKTLHLLGDGLLYHQDKFENDRFCILPKELWSPQAFNLHALGWKMACEGKFADPLTLTPKYIRRPEAEEKWEKRNLSM